VTLAAGPGGAAGNLLPYLVGVIVALGGGGGVAALLRSRPEGSKILVDAAQGAVIVQSSVIEQLRSELDTAQRQISELRADMTELGKLRAQVRELEHDNEMLRAENGRLWARIRHLEAAG
jgi:TolA-binding protein